jgi:pimeloyl-ACP methyl ester carboxylesterase
MRGRIRFAIPGLILAMCLSVSAQNPLLRLPVPTGQHPVGRTSFLWSDASRTNRPVRADVWYPARAASGLPGQYFPSLEPLARNPATGPAIANFFGSDLQRLIDGSFSTNAYDNAPMALEGKPFPVLLFSHGLGQSPFTYSIQIEDLASHGYIVVALSHVGNAVAVWLSDGTAVPFDSSLWAKDPPEAHLLLSAQDLVFALNRMTTLSKDSGSAFNGALDLDRVGAFGHSSGGRAAAATCLLDPRIRACMNQDGGLPGPEWPSTGQAFRGTFAILDWFDPALDAEDYAGMRTTPSDYARQILRPTVTEMETWRKPERGSFRITLLKKGMLHTAFTDMRWLTATSNVNRARFLDYLALIREVTRDFFDQTLNGRSSSRLSCTPKETDLLVQCYSRDSGTPKP